MQDYLKEFNSFNAYFSQLLHSLLEQEHGFYSFDFYFYVEGDRASINIMVEAYTQDLLNKDCYNLLWGQYGYTNFGYFIKYLKPVFFLFKRYFNIILVL